MPPHERGNGRPARPAAQAHNTHILLATVLAVAIALTCPALAAPTRPQSSSADTAQSPSKQGPYALPDDPSQWTERDTRVAFARVVDPLVPWGAALGVVEEDNTSWLNHWLSMGGEGVLTVMLANVDNVTLPHRPAAFPSYLESHADLPITGTLVPFVDMPKPKPDVHENGDGAGVSPLPAHTVATSQPDQDTNRPTSDSAASSASLDETWSWKSDSARPTLSSAPIPPERACVPPSWPPIRPHTPKAPFVIALVERGGCDFATKVRAAQERGAAAVVVGDSVARPGETDEEGRRRENLITMFSPEDTTGIIIPSVFVSRASYLTLRDLLSNHSSGLYVELGEPADDGNALGSLLTFALLMPSLFLLVTIAAHRLRVARQREANRAPPTVVLSLPERVWSPDIVWEKDDSDESDKDIETTPVVARSPAVPVVATEAADTLSEQDVTSASPRVDSANESPAGVDADDEAEAPTTSPRTAVPKPTPVVPHTSRRRGKERRKSQRYYSKDECAICMDNFHRGEVVRILPCGHVFHKDECDEWLLKWRKLCPTCRADVTVSPGDLASSATLTPVVDRTAAPVQPGYGAVDGGSDAAPPAGDGWRDQLGAGFGAITTRVGAAARSLRDSVSVALGRADTARADETTPLIGAPGGGDGGHDV